MDPTPAIIPVASTGFEIPNYSVTEYMPIIIRANRDIPKGLPLDCFIACLASSSSPTIDNLTNVWK